jgi:transposase InsO family protein
VFLDLREAGETCSKHRVARLMREHHLRALHGYRVRRWAVGTPTVVIPNRLQRQLTVTRRNKAWGTDITFGRGKAGSTWPSSWICTRGRSSAGRLGRPFTETSCWMPCSGLYAVDAPMGR